MASHVLRTVINCHCDPEGPAGSGPWVLFSLSQAPLSLTYQAAATLADISFLELSKVFFYLRVFANVISPPRIHALPAPPAYPHWYGWFFHLDVNVPFADRLSLTSLTGVGLSWLLSLNTVSLTLIIIYSILSVSVMCRHASPVIWNVPWEQEAALFWSSLHICTHSCAFHCGSAKRTDRMDG